MAFFTPALYSTSRQGSRVANEDRLAHCVREDTELLLLADGLGGYHQGALAAEAAITAIEQAFAQQKTPLRTRAQQQQFLTQAIQRAHYAIIDKTKQHTIETRAATTMVVGLIDRQTLITAHAGDSRLYVIRRQQIIYQTRDHTYPSDNGMRTHRIYSCLGKSDRYRLDISDPIPLQEDDIILLCSDGLWEGLIDKDLTHSINPHDIANSAEGLLNIVSERLNHETDNMSILLRYWSTEPDELVLSLHDEDM